MQLSTCRSRILPTLIRIVISASAPDSSLEISVLKTVRLRGKVISEQRSLTSAENNAAIWRIKGLTALSVYALAPTGAES